MYRAIALASLRQGLTADNAAEIAEIARTAEIRIEPNAIFLNGEDVSTDIRTVEVSANVYLAADNPQVRERLVLLQQEFVGTNDTVTEGRDQGTVAFPQAPCKIFLTASPRERARRRAEELRQKGIEVTIDEVLAQQNERDERDATRSTGRLIKAADAIEVVTDGLTTLQVVDRLEEIVRAAEVRFRASRADAQ
jgi:cytidylate kinase